MIGVQAALDQLLAEVDAQPVQSTDLLNAAGRFLAEPVAAPRDAPPFDNSAMDGFAVRCADLAAAASDSPVVLPLHGEIIAGTGAAPKLEPGATLRINTGAPLPDGAQAVVRVEDVEIGEGNVKFFAPVPEGLAVRRAGEDFKAGATLLRPGRRIDSRCIGLLASLGLTRVPVARLPRVALLASGDELREPGEPLAFGQIYNSSRYALQPLLRSFGAEVHDLGKVGDTPEATREALGRGFEFDALITTGGVSMGTHDFIRPVLIELGARQIFWKVKQRPGRPIFIAKKDRTLCFGLPGNPVSVFVTALVYVRAALLRMQGATDVDLPWRPAVAAAAFKKKVGLTFFARADYAGKSVDAGLPALVPSAGQGSHQFSAFSSSAGLVRIPEDSGDVRPGQSVEFLEFDRLF